MVLTLPQGRRLVRSGSGGDQGREQLWTIGILLCPNRVKLFSAFLLRFLFPLYFKHITHSGLTWNTVKVGFQEKAEGPGGPMTREEMMWHLTENNAHVADGLDDAIIGICHESGVAVYSVEKIVEIFVKRDGMTQEEAIEFFDYNVVRAAPYYDNAPIFINLAEDSP